MSLIHFIALILLKSLESFNKVTHWVMVMKLEESKAIFFFRGWKREYAFLYVSLRKLQVFQLFTCLVSTLRNCKARYTNHIKEVRHQPLAQSEIFVKVPLIEV